MAESAASEPTYQFKPYYVYVLAEQKAKGRVEVFYVGKGTASRVLRHGELARLAKDVDNAPETYKRIIEIEGGGRRVLELVVTRVDTEQEAFAVEAVLISWMYGLRALTNKVSGHGHQYVRPMGQYALLPHLDVVPAPKNARTGEFTKDLERKIAAFDIESLLSSFTQDVLEAWKMTEGDPAYSRLRTELGDRGLVFSEPDTQRNKTAPHVLLDLWDPFKLCIVKRPSAKPEVSLTFNARVPETSQEFEKVARSKRLKQHLKDRGLKMPGTRGAYFLLKDWQRAVLDEPMHVLNAILFLHRQHKGY